MTIRARKPNSVSPSAKPQTIDLRQAKDVTAPPVIKRAVKSPEINTKKSGRRISFAKLFKNAAKTDSKYVNDVRVTKLKPSTVKSKGLSGFVSSTITIDDKGARKYNHYVYAMDGKPVVKSKEIKVSCQCARFKYFYEYALSTYEAADIEYSNGRPAYDKNPANFPSACKHVLAVLYTIYLKSK